ncbi:MAG TPA: murein biosynthesis integral membrane protein MurJ [Ktedonobacteraceae bacterium]|nr:murein biosynthesis integral membrane protein MurJ [Ktedonobacteraceae bacterium]
MVAVAVETQLTPSPTPTSTPVPPTLSRWFGNAFKIDLKSFRAGGISLRKFSITEGALLLIAGYLASRGLGVVRQSLFNAMFGTGIQASAYYAAYRLPDTLFELIAGGALSHAFIPVFISYEKDQGRREAWRLASLVFNILLVVLTLCTLIAEFVAPVFVSHLLVPGYSPATQALTTSLTRIILIQPLILGLGTVASALLNGKRQFLLPAISLAVYNFGLIGGLLFAMAVPGVGIYGPTVGVIFAAIFQVAVMIPGIFKQGVRYAFIWNLKHPGLRQIMRLLGPNVLSLGIAAITTIIDTAFISYMPDKASLAAQHNAHLLFSLPQTLVSQAIGTAALPLLAIFAMNGHYVRFRTNVSKLLTGTLIVSILASLFLFMFGKPLIHLLFQHGAFNKHSSAVTGTALMGYAIALPGLSMAALLFIIFYAMKDAWTPFVINIIGLGIHFLLVVYLLRTLHGQHIILTIPLAGAGSGLTETVLLGAILYFRLRSKVRTDRGMQRLERWRNRARGVMVPALPAGGEIGNIPEPEMVDEASITELFYPTEELADAPIEPEAVVMEEESALEPTEVLELPVEVVHSDVPTEEELKEEIPETATNTPDEAVEPVENPENAQTIEVAGNEDESLPPIARPKQKAAASQRQPERQRSSTKRKPTGNKPSRKKKNNH